MDDEMITKQDIEDRIAELQNEISEFENAKKVLEDKNWPRRKKMYLHGNKENNSYKWEEEWKFRGDVPDNFVYALYEVAFTVDVYKDGIIEIIKVECGKDILEKV